MREMKDSGIEWIGEIPKEWGITNFGNVSEIFGRIGFRGYTTNDLVGKGDGPITLSPSNIIENKLSLVNCSYISWEKYEESPEIKIYKNDIILVKTASVGKCAIYNSQEPATLNPQLVVLKKIKCNSKYLYYQIISDIIQVPIMLDNFGSVIPTITQKNLKCYKIVFPPTAEQQKISAYLDTKCTKIDSIIEKQEKVIEKLKEYKLSKINEIVTDVDGICCHLGHISIMKNGLNFNTSPNGNKVKFLGVGDFKDYFVLNEKSMFSDIIIDDEISDDYLLQNGDIIFVRSNGSKELVGRAVMVENIDYKLTYSGFCIKLRNTRDDLINDKYLLYFFRSPYFRKQLEKYSQGSNISNINQVLLSQISIIIPSLSYQNDALKKLDKLSLCIDSAIEQKQAIIEKLKEYKKSLIYEVVTGKRGV